MRLLNVLLAAFLFSPVLLASPALAYDEPAADEEVVSPDSYDDSGDYVSDDDSADDSYDEEGDVQE